MEEPMNSITQKIEGVVGELAIGLLVLGYVVSLAVLAAGPNLAI